MGSAGLVESFPKAERGRLLKHDIIIPVVVWLVSRSSRCVTGKGFDSSKGARNWLPSFEPSKPALLRLDHKCSSRKHDPGIHGSRNRPAPRIRASVRRAVRIRLAGRFDWPEK